MTVLSFVSQEEKRTGDTAEIASVRSTVYKASKFPSCERNGVDQGIHNVLVHNKLIPNIKVWSQASSPVANMQAKVAIIRVTPYSMIADVYIWLHVFNLSVCDMIFDTFLGHKTLIFIEFRLYVMYIALSIM